MITENDFENFYREQKTWDWSKGAMPEIIIQEKHEGLLVYRKAIFAGYALKRNHFVSKLSRQAKRNKIAFEYHAIYRKEDGVLTTYHIWLGACLYPTVDELNEVPA